MRGWAKLVLVLIALGVLYWPGIQYHWEKANSPYFVPYDAAHVIPPFFRFDPNDPIPTNFVKEYYLNALSPILYKWSIRIGASLGDVRHFQLGMVYLAYVVFIGILGRLGWLLGGAVLSFAVMALTITAWIFIGLGFLGATPRMYAYPVIALILYALIRDHPHLLMVTVIVSGMLYPIVATIGGLCLASWMLLKPFARGSVSHWSWSRRLAAVTLTGFLTLAVLLPLWFGSEPYGRRVVTSDIALYPEAGPDGNYRVYDQLPYKLFGNEWVAYFVGPLYSHGDPIAGWFNIHKKLDQMTVLFVLAVMGLIVFVVDCLGIKSVHKEDLNGGTARLIGFFAVCVVLHVIAWLGAPYLYVPTRFFMYSLPFLITFIFPWSLYILLGRVPRLHSSAKLHGLAFLGIVSIYLMAFGARGNVEFAVSSEQQLSKPLADAIIALPKDVLIAGWPAAEMRNVEYVTRRNVFFTAATHHVVHLTYMKIMRERMNAMFDAYLSVDAAPLVRLRQEFGVTHLLVDTRDFTDPAHAPEYFAPWKARIPLRLAEIKGKEYLLNESPQKKAAVFNQNGFLLLDLAKLP